MAADGLAVTGQGDIKRSRPVLGIEHMDLAVNVGCHTEILAQLAAASLDFHVSSGGAQNAPGAARAGAFRPGVRTQVLALHTRLIVVRRATGHG